MHTKSLMMKRENGDECKLSCLLVYSICVFLNYLINNFHILGVGQLTVKPMTYYKWVNELLWGRSLLVPKMLGYHSEKTYYRMRAFYSSFQIIVPNIFIPQTLALHLRTLVFREIRWFAKSQVWSEVLGFEPSSAPKTRPLTPSPGPAWFLSTVL